MSLSIHCELCLWPEVCDSWGSRLRCFAMPTVEGGARQTPPLREGVMPSASVVGRQSRQARPRSAVTVSPTAPGLAPLTGFSRSGDRTPRSVRSEVTPKRLFGGVPPSLGLAASGTICREPRSPRSSLGLVPGARGRGLFMSRPGGW